MSVNTLSSYVTDTSFITNNIEIFTVESVENPIESKIIPGDLHRRNDGAVIQAADFGIFRLDAAEKSKPLLIGGFIRFRRYFRPMSGKKYPVTTLTPKL
jgi:hypothetical protein